MKYVMYFKYPVKFSENGGNETMLIYVKHAKSPAVMSFFFFFLTSRALFTYEGNSNDVRLADKGGECLLGGFFRFST